MQKGQIFQRGKSWVIKFYQDVQVGDAVKRRRVLKRLAPVCREYQTATSVEHLAADLLAPINSKTARPVVSDTVVQFAKEHYLPFCKGEVRPSTYHSYKQAWGLLEPHVGEIKLRDTTPADCLRILKNLAAEKLRARSTLANCRNFLSGLFRHAILSNAYPFSNPVREVNTPSQGAKPQAKNTHAYTLEEVQIMLDAVGEPARTVVLAFALTGLRPCEIRGLRWPDFTGDQINVSTSVWTSVVGETKTAGSTAPVPCVKILATALEAHRKRITKNKGNWIFAGEKLGGPINLNFLYRRTMKAGLQRAGFTWRGWYAFRRGTASILNALGVDDSVIQSVLRHANVQTTQKHYIKVASPQSTAAMRKLETAMAKAVRRKK